MSNVEVAVAEHGVQIREHERRLNTYNGSLERMADSVDALIIQQSEWKKSMESVDQLVVQQAEWRATVRTWGLVLGFVATVVAPVASGLIVYFLTH